MAWRKVAHGGTEWSVSLVAERRANADAWQLVFMFRACGTAGGSFWLAYPLQSSSKSSLFAQAERIPDHELAALVAQRIA